MNNTMLSAEEAYKARVEKCEYNQMLEYMTGMFRTHADMDALAECVESTIKKHLRKIHWECQEEPSYEWKRRMWLDDIDLGELFSMFVMNDVKNSLNRYLSDEDIKKRYYIFFSNVFDWTMDYLEDIKNGLLDLDEDEDDIPSKEDFYRMTHAGTDLLSDEDIDVLISKDENSKGGNKE